MQLLNARVKFIFSLLIVYPQCRLIVLLSLVSFRSLPFQLLTPLTIKFFKIPSLITKIVDQEIILSLSARSIPFIGQQTSYCPWHQDIEKQSLEASPISHLIYTYTLDIHGLFDPKNCPLVALEMVPQTPIHICIALLMAGGRLSGTISFPFLRNRISVLFSHSMARIFGRP